MKKSHRRRGKHGSQNCSARKIALLTGAILPLPPIPVPESGEAGENLVALTADEAALQRSNEFIFRRLEEKKQFRCACTDESATVRECYSIVNSKLEVTCGVDGYGMTGNNTRVRLFLPACVLPASCHVFVQRVANG